MRLLFWLLLFGQAMISFGQNEYSILTLDPSLKKNADAIFRKDKLEAHLSADHELSLRTERVVTVLNRQGNHLARAYVSYDTSRKIKRLEARIYNALGNEIEHFKERDFKDQSAVPGGTLYSDDRIKYLDYTPITYPYTVSLSYEIETKNSSSLPSWYFLSSHEVSVENSRYEIVYENPELRPVILARDTTGVNLEVRELGDRLIYEARHIPAIRKEPYSRPLQARVPRLLVRLNEFTYDDFHGKSENWQELGQWMYHKILSDRDLLPDETKRKAQQLVSGLDDPIAKARKIYEYVQDNTRYISVQVGIGGIQPIPAAEVDRLKYGDCKGLTNYTKALLEAVGVTSYYTHVEAGPEKLDFDPGYPDLSQGNHVILAIPDGEGYQWVDCTSQENPFGFLGTFTDDRLVHLIREDGGELLRTPAFTEEINFLHTQGALRLTETGWIAGDVSMKAGGIQYESRLGLESMSRDDKVLSYKDYWSYLNNLQLGRIQLQNDRDNIVFKEDIEIEVRDYTTSSGNLIFFYANVLNRYQNVPDRVRNRKQDFSILRGFLDEDEFTIRLPEGYAVEALPKTIQLSESFGEYEMRVEYDEETHSISYHRKFHYKKGQYPSSRYNDFREFCKSVSKADMAQVVLKKIV